MKALAIALLAAQVMTTPVSVAPEQPRQTFRSALDVVTVHASVRDRQGRLITGLNPADFEIRDNGQLRPILSVRADRQSPIALAIVVDMSGSMRLSGKMQMARDAYQTVLAQLRQEGDEAAVFTFDEGLHERAPSPATSQASRMRSRSSLPSARRHSTMRRRQRRGGSRRAPARTRRSSCSRTGPTPAAR